MWTSECALRSTHKYKQKAQTQTEKKKDTHRSTRERKSSLLLLLSHQYTQFLAGWQTDCCNFWHFLLIFAICKLINIVNLIWIYLDGSHGRFSFVSFHHTFLCGRFHSVTHSLARSSARSLTHLPRPTDKSRWFGRSHNVSQAHQWLLFYDIQHYRFVTILCFYFKCDRKKKTTSIQTWEIAVEIMCLLFSLCFRLSHSTSVRFGLVGRSVRRLCFVGLFAVFRYYLDHAVQIELGIYYGLVDIKILVNSQRCGHTFQFEFFIWCISTKTFK